MGQRSATTARDGTYSLAVAPGTYIVEFSDSRGATNIRGYYSAAGFTRLRADATPVDAGETGVDGIDVTLPNLVHVTGTVSDPDGDPIAGIEVSTYDAEGSRGSSATTGVDGTYTLHAAPGTYRVMFQDNRGRYAPGWYSSSGFTGLEADASQVVVGTEDVDGIDVTLPAALHITGTVTGTGGTPVADGVVFAFDATGDVLRHAWVAADGTYSLLVAPGAYTLRFRAGMDTYAPGWYSTSGFTPYSASATPVVVSTSDVSGVDVTLPIALHVTGTVTRAGGTPIADIRVDAYDVAGTGAWTADKPGGSCWSDETPNPDASVCTAGDGTYSLAVAPGTYTVQFWDGTTGTYLGGWYSTGGFAATHAGATPVVVSTSDVSGISVTLPGATLGAPTGVTATPGNGTALVAWIAPASDGGSPITGYTATSSPGGKTCTTDGSLSCTVTGLTNGTPYRFTVTATNGTATGPASGASAPVTPSALPGSPTGVIATAGNTSALVAWTAPASAGGSPIAHYTVTGAPGGQTCMTTGLSCMVTGLTNGTPYTFTVTATSGTGTGAASDASAPVTPRGFPGAATGVSATPSDGTALVAWTAPASDGGSPIAYYIVTGSPSGQLCITGASLSCTVTGLANGTPYTFTVIAINAAGMGPASDASTPVTPRTVPDAPTGVTATAGSAAALVAWTAPGSDGGSAITGYTATSSPGGRTCLTGGALSCTVSGLTNGTPYTFTVTATNVAGPGPASGASSPATPRTVPGSPTGVSATAGNTSALVSWTAPGSDGGSPITYYIVTGSPGGQLCITGVSLSCTVTGLTNGTPYTFTVTATNGVGTGPASDASAAVVPTIPAPPTAAITALPTWVADTSVALSWSAVAGTSPVASYDVRYRRAAWNGTFGSTVTWQSATSATSASFPAAAGSTYCFSVLARDTGSLARPHGPPRRARPSRSTTAR